MTSITDRISGPTNFGATVPMSRSPFIYNNASVIDSSVREFTNSSTVMRQTSFNKGAGNIIGGATRFNSNPLANSPSRFGSNEASPSPQNWKPKPFVPIGYSHTNKHFLTSQDYVGKIGWAMNNKRVAVAPSRVVLGNQPHKQSFDIGATNEFTKVSGFFSKHTDTKFGIDLATF